MEARLLEYRAKKNREAQIENAKEKITNIFNSNNSIKDMEPLIGDRVLLMPSASAPPPQKLSSPPPTDIEADEDIVDKTSVIDILKNNPRKVMFFMLWFASFLMFVSIQWGAVFFVISALFFVCANTRTGARRIGELSAYSVFNRNCRNIDGPMTPDQFEREMRYGPLGLM